MKLIQVYNSYDEQFMFNTERTDLTDEEIESIIIKSSKMTEEEDALKYLSDNGIERVFIDIEIYL